MAGNKPSKFEALREVGKLPDSDFKLISAALAEIDPAKFSSDEVKRLHRLAIIFRVLGIGDENG